MVEWVRAQWDAKEWLVSGYDKDVIQTQVESQVGIETPVELPKFEICSIQGGKLKVSESSITAFSGSSLTIKAELMRMKEQVEKEMSKPEFCLSTDNKRPRVSKGPGAASSSGEGGNRIAVLVAAPTDFADIMVDATSLDLSKALGCWVPNPDAKCYLFPDRRVVAVCTSTNHPATLQSKHDGKVLAGFFKGAWGWQDTISAEDTPKGARYMHARRVC